MKRIISIAMCVAMTVVTAGRLDAQKPNRNSKARGDLHRTEQVLRREMRNKQNSSTVYSHRDAREKKFEMMRRNLSMTDDQFARFNEAAKVHADRLNAVRKYSREEFKNLTREQQEAGRMEHRQIREEYHNSLRDIFDEGQWLKYEEMYRDNHHDNNRNNNRNDHRGRN